jgi:hypothetical protein
MQLAEARRLVHYCHFITAHIATRRRGELASQCADANVCRGGNLSER